MFSEYRNRKIGIEKVEIRVPLEGRNPLKAFNFIKTEDIPRAIEVLKELHPAFKWGNHKSVACLISHEFSCKCTEEQVRDADTMYNYRAPIEQSELELMYRHCLE